jgi:pyruvate carboxylase subunit B
MEGIPPTPTLPREGGGSLRVRLTDTTLRDGLWLLDLPVDELAPVAGKLDSIGFFSLDAVGGRSFDASLRRGLDPWAWLRRLAQATPATPLQALISGRTLLGDRTVADDVVELFVATAAAAGVDVFRVFDPLNDVCNMEVAVRAARRAGKRVQGTLCYAVSPAHDLDLWRSLATIVAALDVDEIVLMDTSGLLGPRGAGELVGALRDVVRQPIVVHARCVSGMASMAYLAAVQAGASVLDTALSPMARGLSEPATEALVAALAGGDHDTGLDLDRLADVKHDLVELMRGASVDAVATLGGLESDVLRHQLPALMLDDLHRQLEQHRAESRMREALEEVPRVRAELGFPPLVAPVRQIVATQAVYNVLGGDRYATVSQELKEYLQGLYGAPPRPADAEVRRLVLGQDEPITIRPADLLEPQVEGAVEDLRSRGVEPTDERVLTYLLFPTLALDLFLAPSTQSKPQTASTSEAPPEAASPNGMTEAAPPPEEAPAPPQAVSAEFDVEVEGEVFRVRVAGAGVAVLPAVTAGAPAAAATAGPAPARARDGAVTAPMQGLIVKVPVQVGDDVKLGDVVAVLEAMKMQNDIVATQPGKVLEIYVKEGDVVSPNQALVAVG